MKNIFISTAFFVAIMLNNPAYAIVPFVGPAGSETLTPPLSDIVNNYALVASTAQTITWPTGTSYAIVNAPGPYWIAAQGQTATVPTVTNSAGTGSALSPSQFSRNAQTSFSIISSTAQVISISFYK